MDSLHLCLAMGPLGVYLLVLGAINLMGSPLVTTGARDMGALGIGLSGFILAGPMELFLPEAAVNRFGPFVWILILALYMMCLTLLVLVIRPRLVIYNITLNQLRSVLAELAGRIDTEARWAGDSLVLPQLGVQLHLDYFRAMRNISLVSSGPRQHLEGWRRLETSLVSELRKIGVSRNPRGYTMVVLAVVIFVGLTYSLLSDPVAIAQELKTMFRL